MERSAEKADRIIFFRNNLCTRIQWVSKYEFIAKHITHAHATEYVFSFFNFLRITFFYFGCFCSMAIDMYLRYLEVLKWCNELIKHIFISKFHPKKTVRRALARRDTTEQKSYAYWEIVEWKIGSSAAHTHVAEWATGALNVCIRSVCLWIGADWFLHVSIILCTLLFAALIPRRRWRRRRAPKHIE